MKMFVGLAVLFLLAFGGALVGVLAMTGNLNAETMARLRGEGPEVEAPSPVPPDDLDVLTREVKAERERVAAEAARLTEEQKRLELARQSLEDTYTKLENLTAQFPREEEPEPAAVKRDEERLRQQVKTLLEMRESKAAEILETMYKESPQQVAQILSLMPEKERASILGRMEKPAEIADLLNQLKPELAGAASE